MIDSSAKPLPQSRLSKLVHGLQERAQGSLRQAAEEVEQLQQQLAVDSQAWENLQQQILAQREASSEHLITQWDEALQACWDSAELQTFRAVYETAEKERQAKRAAKGKIESLTADAQKRIDAIDRQFLVKKEAPIKRLRNFRAANLALKEKLTAAENAAHTSLAQRSLNIPGSEHEPLAYPTPDTSARAYQQLQELVEEVDKQCQRVTNNRLANFFESFAFWALCGLVFVSTVGILLVSGAMELVPSILTAAAVTVVFLLLGFFGLRPWLKKSVAAEYPKLMALIDQGERTCELGDQLAVRENEAELTRLAKSRDEKFAETKQWRDQQAAEITRQFEQEVLELRQHAATSKMQARDTLQKSLSDTDVDYQTQMHSLKASSEQQIAQENSLFERKSEDLRSQIEQVDRGSRLRLQVAADKALRFIGGSRSWCQQQFPAWEAFHNPEHWPPSNTFPIVPLGHLRMDSILSDYGKEEEAAEAVSAPVLFSPLQDQYLVIHGDPANLRIKALVRNLILRAFTSLPAGQVQVCVVDPPGLGRDYGWLMHLGDFDAELVHHRVWTQPGHISRQLSTLALAAEDFIQQSLRNQYSDISSYNQDAGALAEPYRMLVWSSLPNGLDDSGWRSLQSLLDSGARCGFIPILIVDPNHNWPYEQQRQVVERRGLHLRLNEDGATFSIDSDNGRGLVFEPAEAPSEEQAQSIIQEVGRRSLLAHRVEVPLEKMLPPAAERWQADSSNLLEIPIGQSGVGRTHALKLGVGTAQHGIVAGKTGSGKSSLLHAMITSAVMKYSPERLRLVLLDFKKGVEFQVYADAELAHADIIGVESHREFGLSALQYVDDCLQRRGELFRQASVQDIASWNLLHPERTLPRMLLVIDEFQELFVEDDKLSGQASLILDRIVRQGRSFGVHAILASQTLAGSYTLPRTTLGQMAVRIALQCDASDAQIIFAEDNPAASRLKHPGQAVYNDAGGRIEGNQPMQIGWLTKARQVEMLSELPLGYRNADPTTNRLARTVVYDGNRAATWEREAADLALETAQNEVNRNAIWCLVGESVAIEPAVVLPLTQQSGRNLLMVGQDDQQAASVMDVLTASFVRAAHVLQPECKPRVAVIQAAKPTDAHTLQLCERWKQLPCDLECVDSRQAESLIGSLHAELQQRMADPGAEPVDRTPILVHLIQIGRIKSLRKEDDFASFGEAELKPDKQLEEILRDGPSQGIYVMIWAENYSTVNRWLSRTALREIEVRLLMQMSASDSTNLVDSIAASRLGEHVMLLFDEATGQEQRFRPYAADSLAKMYAWTGDPGGQP
ncbi:MAG: FtsK/SpoIIIE domain-containing protein [bacterium]|nr:FtsK/SpoIIIE domain-containing protein [bacterium]